jgi:hypothetical protein
MPKPHGRSRFAISKVIVTEKSRQPAAASGIMLHTRSCSLRGGCDVTDQAEPGRPPAHDLSAFDLTKRSPEQLAQSFARWKAQRKRPPEAEATRASPPIAAQPSPAIAEDAAPGPSAGNEPPKAAPAKRSRSVQYSDTFSALLAAGSEPTVQRAVWTPVAARPSPKRNDSPGRWLKAMSVVAGAASILALAGGALLELSDWRDSTEAEPKVAQVHPQQFPIAGPIASAATRAPAVEWKLQRAVDLALMKAAPAADAAKPMQPAPEPPTVQTASKAATTAPPGPAKKAAPATEQFVAKPFVPSAASSPAVVPATQKTAAIPAPPVAAVARTGDPRPDALFQYSRDKNTGTAGNRVASGGKPAAATESKSAVDTRSATTRTATARSAKVANGSGGDPRGEVSGGASVGPDTTSASGGDAGDASGGADAGDGTTGDGSVSSGAGSGDTGSADTGGSATGGSDTGGDAAGGEDAGNSAPSDGDSGDGDSGDGDSGSSDGEDGDSGAISGALGGIGDALGDALGGGENKADSEDKDQKD